MKRRLPFSGSVDGDHDGSEREGVRVVLRTELLQFLSPLTNETKTEKSISTASIKRGF